MKKFFILMSLVILAIPAKSQKHEVSVSYGMAVASSWMDTYTSALTDLFTDNDSDISAWGAVTAGYNYSLSKKFSVGIQAFYSSNKERYKNHDEMRTDNSYIGIMPGVKWGWFNGGVVSLYSRGAAGVLFAKSKYVDSKDNSTMFAFQVSPIGVEVGKTLAGYAEAGVGNSGSLIVGVRYKF